MIRWGIGFVFAAYAAGASADSITVGKSVYKDVYIRSDRSHHYVHFPEEGRVEKLSRKRQDVSEPVIEADAALRDALLARFEETKPASPEDIVEVPDSPLNNSAVEAYHRVRELALFEGQLEHWGRLTVEQRVAVDSTLMANAWGTLDDFIESASRMGADISVTHSRTGTGTSGTGRTNSRSPQVGSNAQRITRGAGSSANGTQRSGSPRVAVSVRKVQPTVRRNPRDFEAIRKNLIDDAKRTFSCKQRIDDLDNAFRGGYQPELEPVIAASWEGSGSRKTAPFSIDAPFWRLDCLRNDFGRSGSFSVTVFDADNDAPLTRIASTDFLQMRVRVLDGPGRFYLKIEQDESGIPYDIRTVTFEEQH